MKLKITNEIAAKMAALAVRAASPTGLGFMHFQPADNKISFREFMEDAEKGYLSIDYYGGRSD